MLMSARRQPPTSLSVLVSAGLCLGLMAVSPVHAAEPTPVPAPIVDLDGSESTETSSPTVETSPSAEAPSASLDTATVPVSDSIGGGRLGENGPIADLSAGAEKLPKVKARTWVLADATTGEVLAAKNAHKQRRPASTLKTLTALTLLPKLDLDATWNGTAKAQNTYGSKAGIRKGREYTIRELFSGLLLPSGNDAAIALAQANSTVKKTVAEMNQVAEELQAYDTTAKNTSGLDAKGQFSTAYDLALIGRAAIAREDFLEFVGSKRAEFPNPGKPKKNGKERKPIFVYNQNDLVMENYPGAIGVKTGYTSKAGRTFIGAAKRGGTTLIVTLMGISEPSDEAARKLLNWGFKNREDIIPVGELVPPLSELEQTDAEISVELGEQATVAVTAATQAAVTIPSEPEFAALSPTSWGWLAVFAAAIVLLLAGIIRRLVTRRRRRLLT